MIQVPDFSGEAKLAAVNEACEPGDPLCSITELCPSCRALARAIEGRLIRAFRAGAEAASEQAKLVSPHRVGP